MIALRARKLRYGLACPEELRRVFILITTFTIKLKAIDILLLLLLIVCQSLAKEDGFRHFCIFRICIWLVEFGATREFINQDTL